MKRKILKIMYNHEQENPGNLIHSDKIIKELGSVEQNKFNFNTNYLKNKGFIRLLEISGNGGFLGNITHYGIDLIENPHEFNTQLPVFNITNVNNSKGVVVSSNDVQIDINDSINIKNSFNGLYEQINPSDVKANEIKEKIKVIEMELNKDEISPSKIRNSNEWLKMYANWSIPIITQIITAVFLGKM